MRRHRRRVLPLDLFEGPHEVGQRQRRVAGLLLLHAVRDQFGRQRPPLRRFGSLGLGRRLAGQRPGRPRVRRRLSLRLFRLPRPLRLLGPLVRAGLGRPRRLRQAEQQHRDDRRDHQERRHAPAQHADQPPPPLREPLGLLGGLSHGHVPLARLGPLAPLAPAVLESHQ
jgi:hypothetical protein